MWRKVLFIILLASFDKVSGKARCGGVFTAARGIIQTPGFPNRFPVPIYCEWVIDAQNLVSQNTSIIVYLTQLFVFEGLKFTEYQVYDKTFQFNGRNVHVVNETNVVDVRTVQTSQNYMVISLKLDIIESTHLRVLDNFLDVYGFNITYEITNGPARSGSCNMMDCGFNGVCYDYYTKFSCECFPGYMGSNCSNGPSSYCNTSGTAVCRNGGTCTHVGVSAVKCHCSEAFTGDTCEVPISASSANDCEKCIVSCPFTGKLEDICNCSQSTDLIGFSTTMHLGNLPKLKGAILQEFIQKQVLTTLMAEHPKVGSVHVRNIKFYRAVADVTFLIHDARSNEKLLLSTLTKWAERGYISNITVADKDLNFRTIFSIQDISVNTPGTIREHDEFILSCVARGSSSMSFRWIKDGYFINVSTSMGHKWNRIIKDPHVKDQYTALLEVIDASILDKGFFTCQVEDLGFQQCISKRIQIKQPPLIRIDPMSLTVHKGENFTIKCISLGETIFNKYIYSWTKNKELLPIQTETENYEILYPGGSILQVSRIDKSVRYSCLVQDGAVSAEVGIDVNVVDRDVIRTCQGEKHLNVLWPETAPDTESVQDCPRTYIGTTRRLCSLTDPHQPTWQLPDFSQCTPEVLYKVYLNFQKFRLGYKSTSVDESLEAYQNYLNGRSAESLLPGEGARILSLTHDVISFINGTAVAGQTNNITRVLFDIVDKIMAHKGTLINQSHVKLLQSIVKELALLSFSVLENSQSALHQTYTTIDINMVAGDKSSTSIRTPVNAKSYQSWLAYKLQVNMGPAEYTALGNISPVLVSVVYRNLSSFLPPRSVIRLKDGSEIEYEVLSQIASAWLYKPNKEEIRQLRNTTLSMEFIHNAKNASLETWNLKCAVTDFATYGYTWDPLVCHTLTVNATTTRCSCPRTGTFALILTTTPQKTPLLISCRYDWGS